MKAIFLTGVGMCAQVFRSLDDLRTGIRSEPEKPACAVVPSRLRRHLSLLARMQIEAMTRAAESGGVDLSRAATVFGSGFGECQIAVAQMRMMVEPDGVVSPAYFKNSVHNTSAGAFSIATGNTEFTTSLAGDDQTFATALMETFCLIETGTEQVVLVVGDEQLPAPLDMGCEYESVAVAFAVSGVPPSEPPLATFSELAFGVDAEPLVVPEAFSRNPCAPGLGLLLACEEGRSGRFNVGPTGPWSLKVGRSDDR